MPTKKVPRPPKPAQAESDVFTWMQAIAAHEAADASNDWNAAAAGDARMLFYRAEDPKGLELALEAFDDTRFGGPVLEEPRGFKGWRAVADALWARLGVTTDPDVFAEGARLEVSPYHLRVAEAGHPLFNADKARRPTQEFVASVMAVGYVIQPVQVAVWPDDDDLALYITDGRRRWEAVREVNRRLISDYCGELPFEWPKNDVAPAIIRTIRAEVTRDDRRAQVVRAVANHHHLAENVVSQAREAAKLHHQLGYDKYDTAAMLGVSYSTVDNLLKLAKLAVKLRDPLEAGQLAPTLAYLLATQTHKKQLACWAAVRSITKPADRLRAAEHWLKHGKLPELATAAKPVSTRRIVEAAERLRPLADDAEVGPFALLVAALAGDAAALARVPTQVRQALEKPRPGARGDGTVWADFTMADEAAWLAVGAMSAAPASALRAAGLTPDLCAVTRLNSAGQPRTLAQLYSWGELTLEEVKSLVLDAPLSLVCPDCLVEAGRACVEPEGVELGRRYHPGRALLAARGQALSADEREADLDEAVKARRRPATKKARATTKDELWGRWPEEAWEAADVFDRRVAAAAEAADLNPEQLARRHVTGRTFGAHLSDGSLTTAGVQAALRQVKLPNFPKASASALSVACRACKMPAGTACLEDAELGNTVGWAMDEAGIRVHTPRKKDVVSSEVAA